jgi:hypothetical protein
MAGLVFSLGTWPTPVRGHARHNAGHDEGWLGRACAVPTISCPMTGSAKQSMVPQRRMDCFVALLLA